MDRARGQRRVPVEFLRPNPRNPRKAFDEADLDDLTASIREKGIIQPILVRTLPGMADVSRSSPANAAGVPRSARVFTRCRSS